MKFFSAIKSFFSNLFKPAKVEAPAPPPVKEPQPAPAPAPSDQTPWRSWFVKRLGWSENNPDQAFSLSKGWKYTNVPNYKGVAGADRAWCAMSLCTALEENGFKSSRDAAAISYQGYGTGIDWRKVGIPKAAIVVLEHSSGGHHVTTANRDHKAGEKFLEALGGNQGNAIRVSTYNVSPNIPGADTIVAVRWPVKKPV